MIETTLLPTHIGSPEPLYQDPFRRLYRVVAQFDGFTKEYYVSDSGQRAAVLVVRQAEVFLVRQYRLLINGLSLEVSGGKVDDGETPEAAAVRECQEETGVCCFNLQPLVFYYPGLDISDNPTHLFFCESVVTGREAQQLDPREVSHWEWVPLEQCLAMIFCREIQDSLTMLGLLAYKTSLALSVQE